LKAERKLLDERQDLAINHNKRIKDLEDKIEKLENVEVKVEELD
jgi:hypothetical protein